MKIMLDKETMRADRILLNGQPKTIIIQNSKLTNVLWDSE